MRDFDLSPLFRSAIGFDRLPSLLDTAMRTAGPTDSYPPYNIEKTGEDAYRISIAVAGFSREDLEIEVRDGVLLVRGKNAEKPDGVTYLHRGIAGRAFERRFQLADHIEVVNARLENGLLDLDLVREVPESLKPRKIAIGNGSDTAPLIETEKAA